MRKQGRHGCASQKRSNAGAPRSGGRHGCEEKGGASFRKRAGEGRRAGRPTGAQDDRGLRAAGVLARPYQGLQKGPGACQTATTVQQGALRGNDLCRCAPRIIAESQRAARRRHVRAEQQNAPTPTPLSPTMEPACLQVVTVPSRTRHVASRCAGRDGPRSAEGQRAGGLLLAQGPRVAPPEGGRRRADLRRCPKPLRPERGSEIEPWKQNEPVQGGGRAPSSSSEWRTAQQSRRAHAGRLVANGGSVQLESS